MALANLERNVDTAKRIIKMACQNLPERRGCFCSKALENAIITSPEQIPGWIKRDWSLLIGKYVH